MRRRRIFTWIAAPALLLLAGGVIDSARAASDAGVRRAATRHTLPFVPGAPVQFALLLQKQDCAANLRMLDILQAAPLRDRLRLAVLWYVGPIGDSTAIRTLLPTWTASVPLRHAPPCDRLPARR